MCFICVDNKSLKLFRCHICVHILKTENEMCYNVSLYSMNTFSCVICVQGRIRYPARVGVGVGGGGGTILFIFVVVEYTAFIGRGPGVAKALAGSRGSAPVDISCISKGYLMASPDTLIGNFKAGKCNTAHYCQCISFLLLFLFRMSGGSAHDALHCIFSIFFFHVRGVGSGVEHITRDRCDCAGQCFFF